MVTFTASLTCMLVLVLIKEGINTNKNCKVHLIMPIPIELIVISVSTIVSYYTKLGTKFNVEIVGEIPSGLPQPALENLKYIPDVLGDGLTIGFIAYAISYSMAKILADRHGYRVNANQELVALGVCNFVSSFFSSYCCAASLSRSLVQDAAGGKTQVVGLVSSVVVLVVLLYIGPLFESLPECILASIVIVTLKGMFEQFGELGRLWRLSKKDFAVWLVTFIAVVVLDVALGLLIGIVFSLYFVLRHSQKPQMSELGQLPGTGAYKDFKATLLVKEVPGMKIFRFETSIYFANAEHFRDRLYEKTKLTPRKLLKRKRKAMHETLQRRKQELEQVQYERKKREARKIRPNIEIITQRPVDEYEEQIKKATENKLILDRFSKSWQPPIKVLILDLSVVNYVDTVAVKQLSSIVKDYKEVGIKVFLAGCKPDVRLMLRNAEFYKTVDYMCLFYTVHEAVIIGQEILEGELRKNIPKREDVKLMIELSVGPEDKDESDQEIYDDDDDEDDEDDDAENNKMQVHSDDDEQWYDTTPDDLEMRAVGILHREFDSVSNDGQSYGVARRPGSIIKDDNFEMISLKESIK